MSERLALKSPTEPPDGGPYRVDLPENFGSVTRPDVSDFLARIAEKEPRDMDGRTVTERFYANRPSKNLTPIDDLTPRQQELPLMGFTGRNLGPLSSAEIDAIMAAGEQAPSSATTPDAGAGTGRSPRKILVDPTSPANRESPAPEAPQRHKEASLIEMAMEARAERPPMFTNASTGEKLSLADVKARMADAGTSPETIGIVADFAAETLPTGQAVTHEFGVDTEGNIHETQTAHFDGVELEAVIGLDGTVEEVSVIIDAEAPAEGEDTPEQHTVTVVEPTPEHSAIVAIDDEPVTDPESLKTAADIVEHAAELVSEQNKQPVVSPEEQPVSTEQPVVAPKEQAPEAVSKSSEHTEAGQQQLLRGAHNAIQAYVYNPETAAAMKARGVDFKALSDRFRSGKVDIMGEGARAFRELIAEVKPDSPLWNTKPGTNSALGRAAEAQRARLANILRSL